MYSPFTVNATTSLIGVSVAGCKPGNELRAALGSSPASKSIAGYIRHR